MKARCVSSTKCYVLRLWTPRALRFRARSAGSGGGEREWALTARRSRRRPIPPAGPSNTHTDSVCATPSSSPLSLPRLRLQRLCRSRSPASPPMSHSSIRASLVLRRDSPSGCFENATAAPSDIELPNVSPRAARARRRLHLRDPDLAMPGLLQAT